MVALALEFVHFHRVAVKRKFAFVLGPLQQPRYHHAGGVQIVGDDLVGAMQGQISLNLYLVGKVKMKGPSAFKMVCTGGQNPNDTRKSGQKKTSPFSETHFVPRVGLEPTRPKRTHGPQPCLSTNFSTWAVQRLMRLL